MTIEMARRIADACKQRARELRSPVSIAIVDAGGHLVLFERMMAPYGWATGNISIAKATTAVMFNQSTDAVAQWGSGIPGFASSMATMTQGKFIMAAGGWPIRVGGATIGVIGISGGNAPGRDDDIARAGLGVLEAAAPPLAAQPIAQRQPVMPAPTPMPQPYSQPVMQPALSYPSTSPQQAQPAGVAQNQPGPAPSQQPAQQEYPPATGTSYLSPEQNNSSEQYQNPSENVTYDNVDENENRSGGQS